MEMTDSEYFTALNTTFEMECLYWLDNKILESAFMCHDKGNARGKSIAGEAVFLLTIH